VNVEQEYDYVIVGAGSAGCVVANRLTEDASKQVLLIEAGGPARHPNVAIPVGFGELIGSKYDWLIESEPEPTLADRQIILPRGKVIGGSSSINAMVYFRGHKLDFDNWAALGATGWAYDDVLPYFKRSEHNERFSDEFHGVGGPLNVTDAHRDPLTTLMVESAVKWGVAPNSDFNGAETDGVGPLQVTQKKGRRWSEADAFLRPAKKRKNLTVLTGALVHRVAIEGGKAVGVVYDSGNGPETVRAGGEVVICAGAYGTPALLQLSGVGPASHLGKLGIDCVAELPVGENLMDHASATLNWEVSGPDVGLADAKHPKYLAQWLFKRSGKLTSNVMEANACIRIADDVPAPDFQLAIAPAYFFDHGRAEHPNPAITLGPVMLQPESRGTVRIRSADPRTLPSVRLNFFSQPGELDRMTKALKICREIIAGGVFGSRLGREINPGPSVQSDADVNQWIQRNGEHLYHPVGTARIGTPETGVVDPELRVYGIDRLRVADASVMPMIVRANTNAATIMIGERCADFIRGAGPRHASNGEIAAAASVA
jgi:choline dehydrogenase